MNTKRCYITLVLLLVCSTAAYAQIGNCTSPVGEAFLDVNNVRARIPNSGSLFWRAGPSVYTVPKDGGSQAIYAGTILVGGLISGDVRTSAARYGNYEFWSGPLDESGNPPADCSVYDRVWKVDKRDVVQYENSGSATTDLMEWPTGLGAPTLAADGSAIDLLGQPLAQREMRSIDLAGGERPDFTGDQMLWWIMNDRGNEHTGTETEPIGIEVHATAFAFDMSGPPGSDATFYRYRIINRNTSRFEDAYFGLFLDSDLGDFADDYVGSDTTLNLAYTYNADNSDEGGGGYGENPPAVGTSFVRGALAPMVGDSAIVKGSWQTGLTNQGMTSFIFFFDGPPPNGAPVIGSAYYQYMRGRWMDGRRIMFGGDGFESDTTSIPTNFMFSGDPVTKEYWSEFNSDGMGKINFQADRQYIASTGPFTLNPGDEQEIIVAIPWARGDNHLDSVTKLREAAVAAQQFADRDFDLSPSTVDAPLVSVSPIDQSVILKWTNTVESNNYQDSFQSLAPFALENYLFQGYRVHQFDSPTDTVGRILATYDIVDGVTRIIEGPRGELTALAADGSDSGLRHDHVVDGLTNYRTYYFGVQPYATKNNFFPRVLNGQIARVEVTPTGDGEIGIVPNPYRGASDYERLAGDREVRFTNLPANSTVNIFSIAGTKVVELRHVLDGVLTWDLRNSSGRAVGSGMYLVHIDAPGLGSRILKFGVVQRSAN